MFLQNKVHNAQRHGGLVGEWGRILVKIALCLNCLERGIQTEALRSVQQVVEPVNGFRLRRLLVKATVAVFENDKSAFIADGGIVGPAGDAQSLQFLLLVVFSVAHGELCGSGIY